MKLLIYKTRECVTSRAELKGVTVHITILPWGKKIKSYYEFPITFTF